MDTKFEIPRFRYLAQDSKGYVWMSIRKPYKFNKDWLDGTIIIETGKPNQNWENTLIDMETEDYDYTDGILTRIEK